MNSYVEVGTYEVGKRFSRSKGGKRLPQNMDTTVPLYAALVVSQIKYFTFVPKDPPVCMVWHFVTQYVIHCAVLLCCVHTYKMLQGEMPWALLEYKKSRLPQKAKITYPDFAVKPVRLLMHPCGGAR